MEQGTVVPLLEALKAAYQSIGDVSSSVEYERAIEPLVFGISSDERRQLGEALWKEREAWGSVHPIDEPYAYTGLAFRLSPRPGGS